MNNIYVLTATDLSHLGSSMGTEYTTTKFIQYFNSIGNARKCAETDYGKPIEWENKGTKWTSGDLGWIMYDIKRLNTED